MRRDECQVSGDQWIEADMKKTIVGLALSAMLFALCWPAEAQQATKVPHIGFLLVSGDPNTPPPWVDAFRQGLRELGYTEGKNIVIEYRYIEGEAGPYHKPCG